jgi:hypothetical protein
MSQPIQRSAGARKAPPPSSRTSKSDPPTAHDGAAAYSTNQLLKMNAAFVAAVEAAIEAGAEKMPATLRMKGERS